MSVSHAGFYLPWSAALAAASTSPASGPVVIGATVIHFQGIDLPVVQAVLAIAGVLLARPLARKKEKALPLSHFLIVTTIMLVVALAFVAEYQPAVLFTFVVAIGLGFSGYSLIETAGAEMQNVIKRVIDQVTDALSFRGKSK